ncbi:MAG: hypothetical protein IBX36_00145 [Dehalococcoidia bacterium]|nr:hypothetical protein [Dehalococcoidia bacterium]
MGPDSEHEATYNADGDSIQTAVLAYYVDYGAWPTVDANGDAGNPIDMDKLISPPGGGLPYLNSIPESASATNCSVSTCDGSYTWYVDEGDNFQTAQYPLGTVYGVCTAADCDYSCTDCDGKDGEGFGGVYP